MKYPPLPIEFWLSELKVRAERWKHLSDKRKENFIIAHKAHIRGVVRKMTSFVYKENTLMLTFDENTLREE